MDDILDVLVAHGVPGTTIVRVANLVRELDLMKLELKILTDRRERDAERKRRSRSSVRGQSADCHVTVTGHPPVYIEEKIKKKKESKKVSISADWKPDEIDRAYARSKGWPDTRIDTEAERFRNYYLANGIARKSWPASWRNWVTSPFQKSEVVSLKERQAFL